MQNNKNKNLIKNKWRSIKKLNKINRKLKCGTVRYLEDIPKN